ncbi:hypothetical protein CASFOL_008766 [Castilleja foliolosa]|uniref:RNase H type-1 domain-containing protein n=1 Tax=Castilleja foliolosa TaxID=1961234 RepID=A0ABD3DZX5_9LAMI
MVKSVSKNAAAHWKSILQTGLSRPSKSLAWKAPPEDMLKCNIDAAFSNGHATSGVVLRNHNGSIKLAAVFHHQCLDPATAESLAALDACKILSELKIRKVIIESDCLDVVSFVHGLPDICFWSAKPVIEKIKKFWNNWPSWIFKFSPRSSNGCSHALAKWGSSCNFNGFIPLDTIPICVFCDIGFPLVEPL